VECAFGVSRETWYKWKRRYDAYGIDGLKDQSRKARNIKNVKVTEEVEKLVLELRLNKLSKILSLTFASGSCP
jgi:transposase